MKIIFLLVFAMFLVSGCKERHNKAISLAYQLTATAPDSALSILDDVKQAKLSKAEMARYALVYTIAQDKSGLDVDNDSLLRTAYTYYNKRTDDTLYAKCMYYMGTYYLLNDSVEKAIDCLIKSSDIADKQNDKYTQSLALVQLSKALEKTEPQKAVSVAKKAEMIYNTLSNTAKSNLVYYKLNVCVSLLLADSLESALKVCRDAINLSFQSGDSSTISDAYQDMASILNEKKEYRQALWYSKKSFELSRPDDTSKLLNLAWAYLDTDSLNGCAQSVLISGRIIDENQTPIPDACIMVYSQDSTLVSVGLSDSLGEFCIQTDSIQSNKIKVSCLGFKSVWKSLPIDECIELITDNKVLSEVVIKGKRNFTKQTTTGFVYDLSNINFIKDQNLLQAIRLVPFVYVDNEGQISVNGDERCSIYLNGKPFDMAMTNPRQILQSLQAKDVNKIEIVTERDFRFGNNIPAINIITSHNSLNGVYCNGEVRYKTTPNVKAGASFLAKNSFVDFSLSYNYDYQSQHNQPIYQHITTPDNATALQGKGDGNWHTHIFRALTSWHFDSLNVVYADIHAKINKDSYTTRWVEQSESNIGTENDNLSLNQNWSTKGTIEANMIYRNFFKRNSNQEHFSIGYRYAYNPDKRNYIQTSAGSLNPMIQKTDGGTNEHTLNLLAVVPVSSWHQFLFGARTIYRKTEVNSSDNSGLSYSQSITYPYINYTGHLKWFNAAVNLNGEYEYLSIHDEYKAGGESKSNHFYFLPSVKIYHSFGNWNINISYNRNLKRPSIVMLNPFSDSQNGYFQQIGNPDLKAEIKDNINLEAFFFKKRISMSLGLTYSHTDNTILYYQKESSESGAIISSYGNIGRLNTLIGNIFVNWQPVSALVIKCNINGGLYNLSSRNLDLSQKDYTLNVFGWIDYYFPKNWNIGCNITHFKQVPEPFGTVNSITNYLIHIDKTWMKGALATSVELATPFSRYSKFKTKVSNPMFSTEKINYMIARYFGVSISYTFQQGKKSNLKRDSSLINSDQSSGVQ